MKVLIISHNPIRTHHNMGQTLLSLFSAFSREELCQLYIYPTLPNTESCASYYRVTDKDVLRSYWCFHVRGRRVACDRDSSRTFESAADEQIYTNSRNHDPFRSLARDLMWKCAGWYQADLKKWLEEQNPSCIFVAPGPAKFLYDIAQTISKTRNIPIVSYICDDFYFLDPPDTPLGGIYLSMLKNTISRLVKRSAHMVSICDEMTERYCRAFGTPATTLMTGGGKRVASGEKAGAPEAVCFFGNIKEGRSESLAQVGRALDRINRARGTSFRLHVYTGEKNEEVLRPLAGIKSVRLQGFVTGEPFAQAYRRADFLLHVEGFAPENIDRVKYSVSTKIADGLASGIPMIAYGPAQVASMGHLLRNHCAFTAVSPDALEDMLISAFTDAEERQRIVNNALAAAQKHHDKTRNSLKLREILLSAERNGVR